MLHLADCSDGENSRCWGRCRVLPIAYPISQMWRFDYEHNYIITPTGSENGNRFYQLGTG